MHDNAYPIYIIFKKSLQCGQLPAQWKEFLVNPLLKKGLSYSPFNYMSISLTSGCFKTLEREIATHLHKYIDSNGLFNDNQFDFRLGHTVDDQLLFTYSMVLKSYEVGLIVFILFTDYFICFSFYI